MPACNHVIRGPRDLRPNGTCAACAREAHSRYSKNTRQLANLARQLAEYTEHLESNNPEVQVLIAQLGRIKFR